MTFEQREKARKILLERLLQWVDVSIEIKIIENGNDRFIRKAWNRPRRLCYELCKLFVNTDKLMDSLRVRQDILKSLKRKYE
jgi:hypothetical protein